MRRAPVPQLDDHRRNFLAHIFGRELARQLKVEIVVVAFDLFG
ncbi:MAG TPA: hypothetical protein VGB05_07690 [Pyrinomonadaceae bacterium]